MIKAICFDLDGTLVHFNGDFSLFLDGLRNELMLVQCDLKEFADLLSAELHADGAVTLQSALLKTLERLELLPPDDLLDVTKRAIDDYSAQVQVLPGAKELLEFCAERVPLALVTNGPEDMQRAALGAAGIEDYFQNVLISGSGDVAARKPHSRIYELACKSLGSAPEETLMVGDKRENDVQAALDCGMQAVLIGSDAGEGYDAVPDLRALQAWLGSRLEVLI